MAISTFTPGGNEIVTNGTTAVIAVASPGSGVQRLVSSVKVTNTDTTAVDAIIRVLKSATTYQVARSATLAVGATLEAKDIVLDATDESVQVILGAAHTTAASEVTAAFADKA